MADTPFTCGPNLDETCTYLEVAPAPVFRVFPTDRLALWSSAARRSQNQPVGSTGEELGRGAANTEAIVDLDDDPLIAAALAKAYVSPNGTSDWFLPSKDELNELWEVRAMVGGVEGVDGLIALSYWSSSEVDTGNAWSQRVDTGVQNQSSQGNAAGIRPIRAF